MHGVRSHEWGRRGPLDRAAGARGRRAGIFADGSLVITPTEVGDAHALVTIEGSDTPSGGRLTTDPGGFVTVPPYRIYLLSADAGRRAVIAVGPAG